MQRDMGRPSLAEYFLPETLGHNERLERIDAAVDWERLGKVVSGIYASAEGRPSYPPLTLVKVLLLQQWYNLSDPQMEEALGDRLSFRRFVGLGLQDDTPDHSTLSRFRTELAQRGLTSGCLGTAKAIRGAEAAGEDRDVAGCHVGGSTGTATVDGCGTGNQE